MTKCSMNSMRNCYKPVTNKKDFDEKLQEVRGKNHTNNIKYRKRKQEEQEADRTLKEELKRIDDEDESVR